MLGWLRDKIYKRLSESRQATRRTSVVGSDRNDSNPDSGNLSSPTPPLNMDVTDTNRITLHIIYLGEIWVVNIDHNKMLSDLLKMALGHFLDLASLLGEEESTSKFKFISVSKKKVLNLQCSIVDEGLTNYDEILLTERISIGSSVSAKLTIHDIKGPTVQDIFAATANLPKKNTIQVVPALECQDSFQVEIRKVLYSLVEASAKILAQTPDAKVIFSGIAARIDAKYKKEIDENAIKYLVDLGFTEVQARYALRLKRNRQVEAMEWLLENSHRVKDIPDEDNSKLDPEEESDNPVAIIERLLRNMLDFQRRHFEPNSRAVEALTAMGFSQDDVIEALRATNNNQVAACQWLCGEREDSIAATSPGLDKDGPMYKALMTNPTVQLGLYNPKVLLAFLSILDNFSSANLWLNDVDTSVVLGQVFKTYHSEKHMIIVNQQIELMKRANAS
ncbi:ubiquitin-associated domain-containing protein 1-like [Macrosteles quadrilineatus]|uniref:ubiquitin-associated domain-containing protein 1-like n=1 Tax=Macrosteles quadrilineatus TaxID=74068 RepID=UPI0023E35085|nr:ubiquitin-associated domain-containing protein 1-like [Macrosteles quadrilineatus]